MDRLVHGTAKRCFIFCLPLSHLQTSYKDSNILLPNHGFLLRAFGCSAARLGALMDQAAYDTARGYSIFACNYLTFKLTQTSKSWLSTVVFHFLAFGCFEARFATEIDPVVHGTAEATDFTDRNIMLINGGFLSPLHSAVHKPGLRQ